MKFFLISFFQLISFFSFAQLQWQNVDSLYGPLPKSVHVYFTNQPVDSAPFKAYYVIADLKDKGLDFTTDTTLKRRLSPAKFYEKNSQPLVVVNGTFFSFETNQNLNAVVKDGKLVSYNQNSIAGRGKDTLTYRHPFSSAIGISWKRKADVAWTYTDSSRKKIYAAQVPMGLLKDSIASPGFAYLKNRIAVLPIPNSAAARPSFRKWKMETAIGGGPVLVQNGNIQITNNEEWKFAGKAINDKHPRTAMGYTSDNKLIILVIEGRSKGSGGATLIQQAQILKDLGCVEALNLDGGGSSCMLVNGKETMKPSDPNGQRPVPAVFIIKKR
ncbi:MAG TPA: phosphodiester glycosidase family protein [Flavisolibacter sp.]|nr:phosphodiester glycosidase family protein [Flavisolibacter sp.]